MAPPGPNPPPCDSNTKVPKLDGNNTQLLL